MTHEALNDIRSTNKKKQLKKSNRVYLLISLLTIDEYSDEAKVSIVGYAYFPLFLSMKTDAECQKSSDKDFYLNNGHYQIPIYKDSFQNTTDVVEMETIEANFERIPACTLCLRVYSSGAPHNSSMSNRVMSRNNIRSRSGIDPAKE
jgi:hypothetical protein